MRPQMLIIIAALLLPACAAPPPPARADISVLMFGNSHTHYNDLPKMLAALLRAGRPGKTVTVAAAPGYLFLDQRMNDAESQAQFNSRQWNAVVFQAQNYSQSGTVHYSTDEAVEWVRRTRARNIVPVMFPEWARRGIDESEKVYQLHAGIAQRQQACVAPIPQAWELALKRFPALVLHAPDGNHAGPNGSFLAALMLYATLTGESPAGLPAISPYFGVSAATQASLRAIADETVRQVAPRRHCPDGIKL